MKRALLSAIFVPFFCFPLNGQINLVPNGSFDSITSCPNGPAQIYKAVPWIDPSNSTSDLFNLCSSNNLSSAPSNAAGWQNPQTGNSYAGLVTYAQPSINHREYIQAELIDSLREGKAYCLSFFVSWGDSTKYATDGIGAYFSNTPISCSGCFLPYTAQVNNDSGNVLDNSSQWQLVRGSFVAQGGEKYITIGNFKPDSETSIIVKDSNAAYVVAYYYIDDISVVEIAPAIASIGNISPICAGDSVQLGISSIPDVLYSWQPSDGLSDLSISNPKASPSVTTTYTLTQTQCSIVSTATVTVTVRNDCDPPPFFIPTVLRGGEMLIVSGMENGTSLEIFDALGRRVFWSADYQNDFGGFKVAAGTYVLRLIRPSGETIKQKLTVVH